MFLIKKFNKIIILMCLLLIVLSTVYKEWSFIFLFLWFLASGGVTIAYTKAQKRLISILDIDCNPELFVSYMERLVESIKNIGLKIFFQLNLTSGYISNGELDKAEQLFREINEHFQNKKIKSRFLEFFWKNNYMSLLIHQGNFEGAQAIYLKAIEVFNGIKSKNKNVKEIRNALEINRNFLNLYLKKNESESIIFLNKIFNETEKLRLQNEIKYCLGCYYVRLKCKKEAKEAFQFVVDNGNKLFIQKEAVKEFSKLK